MNTNTTDFSDEQWEIVKSYNRDNHSIEIKYKGSASWYEFVPSLDMTTSHWMTTFKNQDIQWRIKPVIFSAEQRLIIDAYELDSESIEVKNVNATEWLPFKAKSNPVEWRKEFDIPYSIFRIRIKNPNPEYYNIISGDLDFVINETNKAIKASWSLAGNLVTEVVPKEKGLHPSYTRFHQPMRKLNVLR